MPGLELGEGQRVVLGQLRVATKQQDSIGFELEAG